MNTVVTDWLDDLRVAVGFLTRVPLPKSDRTSAPPLARAYRVFPLIGAAIGAVIGLIYLGLVAINLPALGAAALALGAGMLLTGALHEDGLADLADGLGGGRDSASKLAIMRDSRIGTYGVLVLLVGFLARLSGLQGLPGPMVLPGLISAHALARAVVPFLAATMPYARDDGLAVTTGRPEASTAMFAGALAFIIALVALPWAAALAATLIAALGGIAVAMLAMRQISGQTGDVLGGAEQVTEIAVLVLLAASLG
jgi:adenosylcobinamide-GDP ribazoletransferase